MVINQFHAIGDILFCEPIFRHFWNKNGEKPIVPLRDHLMWLAEYIESANFVPMSKFKLDYDSMEMSNPDYLPLRFANQIVRGLAPDDHTDYANTMPDKYILCGLDPMLWKTLKINFNYQKLLELTCKVSGTKNIDGHILINENSQAGKINIDSSMFSGETIMKMKEVPGYTVIDWALTILNAKENHHVSTCTFYIMQALCNQYAFRSKVFMYPRPNADGLQGISKLNPDFKYIAHD